MEVDVKAVDRTLTCQLSSGTCTPDYQHGGVEVDVMFINHAGATELASPATLKLEYGTGQQTTTSAIASVSGRQATHDCLPQAISLSPGGATNMTAICFPVATAQSAGPLTLIFRQDDTDGTNDVRIPLR
jgi:hypothetical protein